MARTRRLQRDKGESVAVGGLEQVRTGSDAVCALDGRQHFGRASVRLAGERGAERFVERIRGDDAHR